MNNDRIIAWTRTDSRLNIESAKGGKVTLSETSHSAPAVSTFKGRLYVAWTGTDSRLNVISSQDARSLWRTAASSRQTSKSPAKCGSRWS